MKKFAVYLAELKRKMVKEPLPVNSIACGWALGMFIGCAVPFGFQLIISIPLALAFKWSKIGATVATLITNPVTIWFIYPAQTWAVSNLFFTGNVSYSALKAMEWTSENVFRLGAETIASFFIGGLILALILSPLTYFLVRNIVIHHRKAVA